MRLPSTLLIFSLLSAFNVHAELTPLPRDGIVTDQQFIGYSNINYQAVRFEPLCGSLGTTTALQMLEAPFSIGGQCDPALAQYTTISDTLAFYDLTGVRLTGDAAVVGTGGNAMCMCFSLVLLSGGKSDLCVWIDGNGEGQTQFYLPAPGLGYILQSSYKPGSGKALAQCGNVNVTSLESHWSATAFFPSTTAAPNISTTSNTLLSSSSNSTTSTGAAAPIGTTSSTTPSSTTTNSSSTTSQSTSSGSGLAPTVLSPSSVNGASVTGSSGYSVLALVIAAMIGLQVI